MINFAEHHDSIGTRTDETPVYSPSALLQIFNNTSITEIEQKPVRIKGILQKTNANSYNGYFYNQLKDEAGNQSITLKTAEIRHKNMHDKQPIELYGNITRKIYDRGRIDIHINITDLSELKNYGYPEKKFNEVKLLSERASKGIKDLDALIKLKIIKNEPIAIRIITGKTSIIDEDIRKAMAPIPVLYNMAFHKIALNSATEITKAISQLDKESAHIICISRGGGIDMEIFEDLELCESLLNREAFIASAIGHAENKSLFDVMADRKFDTPTAFGNYLKEIYNITLREIAEAEKGLKKLVNDTREKNIALLNETIAVLMADQMAKSEVIKATLGNLEDYDRKLKASVRNGKIILVVALVLLITFMISKF